MISTLIQTTSNAKSAVRLIADIGDIIKGGNELRSQREIQLRGHEIQGRLIIGIEDIAAGKKSEGDRKFSLSGRHAAFRQVAKIRNIQDEKSLETPRFRTNTAPANKAISVDVSIPKDVR